jgi:hypothetical protein
MYRSSIQTTVQQFLASTLTAILLSGGACYEKPSMISSQGIPVSDLVPSYWLRESIDSCEMIFDEPRFNLKSNSNKRIELTFPAKFTFQGKPLIQDKGKPGREETFLLPCENGDGEFVVTDDRGKERRDKLNLRKIKLQLPQTPIERSKDLKIPVTGAAYPKDMEIKARIDSELEGDGYDDMMMNTEEYKGDRTRITFDKTTQTLTIPTQVLKRIRTKQPILRLEVKTSLYYEYPDKHSSPWFQYEYWTPKQKIVLK